MRTNQTSFFMILAIGFVFITGCDEAQPPQETGDEPVIQEVEAPTVGDDAVDDDAEDEEAGALRVAEDDLIDLPQVPDSLEGLPEDLNAVQFEMQILTAAMQNILRLIADDRLDEIPGQIRQVHPAYELTHQALDQGLYRPPVNPDQLETFEAFDDAFHDNLRALVAAAGDDDLQTATDRYSDLVQGCTSCHGQFRFP